MDQIQAQILSEENVRKYLALLLEGAQKAAPEISAEETAVERVIQTVEAKIRRWEETLENGLLSLNECAARIKELRGQREDLLSRKAALQKKFRRQAKVLPIPTGLMDRYIREMQLRLRQKKIGYKKEFLREILSPRSTYSGCQEGEANRQDSEALPMGDRHT